MPTSFDYTVELERSLLKILITSVIQSRRYIHRVKENLFTSVERKFILEVLTSSINTAGQLATKKVFEYEVGKRVEGSDQQYFIGEWNLVDGVTTQDPPEVLLQKLEEADTGREILKLGANVDVLLEGGQIADALTLLKRQSLAISGVKDERPLVELTDYKKREQTLLDKRKNPDKYKGLATGFDMFDNTTGGLFPGELTLVAGLTGTGKSTFVRQVEMNVVMLNPGANVLHVANEEYLEQVEHKFDANFTEIPYLDFKRGEITDENLEKWRRFMQSWKHGRVFIKEVPAFTEITLAEQAYRQCEARGIKIGLIIIDHLPNVKPIEKTWGENDEQKKAAADCKELARMLRLPVLVPTQAATEVMKKQERGKRGNRLDVYGSKAQVHVANTFMLITETGKDEKQVDRQEWERDVYWLCDVKKNRDGPPFWYRAKHRVRIGRIEEIPGEGAKGDPKNEADAENLIQKDGGVADDSQAAEVASAIQDDADGVVAPEKEPPQVLDQIPMEHRKASFTMISKIRQIRAKKGNTG